MNLRSVVLRDWKQFADARFDFPAPDNDRNVILIGGENGFGKTSLFQAILLGLFGRDGLGLLAGASLGSALDRPEQSYREFLAKALYGNAIRESRRRARIELKFEDDAGSPIEIIRTWYFTDDGTLKQGTGSEQVAIYRGIGREAIGPPTNEADPPGWYRDWIAHEFLPAHLAGFFLFDGEDAASLAEREKSAQVRQGVEGLLGLPWMTRLAADLRDYAGDRRRQAPGGISDTISKVETEIADLQMRLETARTRLAEARPKRGQADQERAALTRELEGFGSASQAQIGELVEEKARAEQDYREARRRLGEIIETDLALAVSGRKLRQAVRRQLDAESIREGWEGSRTQGAANLERFVTVLETELRATIPAMPDHQRGTVAAATRKVWDAIWYPAPEGCATAIRHAHLRGNDRTRVLDRLARAEALSMATMNEVQVAMARAAAAARELQARLDATQSVDTTLEPKKERLRQLNDAIAELDRDIGSAEATEKALLPQLDQKRKELANLTTQLNDAAPAIRRAKRAETIAAMLDGLVEAAVPGQVQPIAQAMTQALQAMAHRKDLLHRVEIGPDCTVRLLGQEGRDMRDYELSAGEKQLFTQALISAVVRVSGRVFPMIVDTPLGRLDEAHRLGVLRHITGRQGQIILISTNTEVVGPWLDAIRSRLLKAYRIENKRQGDLGLSRPVEGYFPGQGLP